MDFLDWVFLRHGVEEMKESSRLVKAWIEDTCYI